MDLQENIKLMKLSQCQKRVEDLEYKLAGAHPFRRFESNLALKHDFDPDDIQNQNQKRDHILLQWIHIGARTAEFNFPNYSHKIVLTLLTGIG